MFGEQDTTFSSLLILTFRQKKSITIVYYYKDRTSKGSKKITYISFPAESSKTSLLSLITVWKITTFHKNLIYLGCTYLEQILKLMCF